MLAHPAVADCAVIPVPDARAGEVPKAFIVPSKSGGSQDGKNLAKVLSKWVTDHKSAYKALRGGIEFVDTILKSPSGKILRRELLEREKEGRPTSRAKL